MTLEQAISEFKRGKFVVVAEYRSSKAENIKWRDQQSGRMLSGVTLTHVLECDGATIMVGERVPDDFDPKEYQPPFSKGQAVLLRLERLYTEKGVQKANGKLEALASEKLAAK